MEMETEAEAGSRSAWTAPSTLLVFAFFALAAQLPLVVDIYAFGGVPRLLFVPSYLLMGIFYAAMDPLEPLLGGADRGLARVLWIGGPLLTYYLAAVLLTLGGRRLARLGRGSGRRGSENGAR
jgi:hypothetical protein